MSQWTNMNRTVCNKRSQSHTPLRYVAHPCYIRKLYYAENFIIVCLEQRTSSCPNAVEKNCTCFRDIVVTEFPTPPHRLSAWYTRKQSHPRSNSIPCEAASYGNESIRTLRMIKVIANGTYWKFTPELETHMKPYLLSIHRCDRTLARRHDARAEGSAARPRDSAKIASNAHLPRLPIR